LMYAPCYKPNLLTQNQQ